MWFLPDIPASCPYAPSNCQSSCNSLNLLWFSCSSVFAWWSLSGMSFLNLLAWGNGACPSTVSSEVMLLGKRHRERLFIPFCLIQPPCAPTLPWGHARSQGLFLFCDYLSAAIERLGHFILLSSSCLIWWQACSKYNYLTNCMISYFTEFCSNGCPRIEKHIDC